MNIPIVPKSCALDTVVSAESRRNSNSGATIWNKPLKTVIPAIARRTQ